MSLHKTLGAVAAVALFAAVQDSAQAQYYSGDYSTFYQPYTTYYGGPTTAYYGGGSGYTTYYGGSYGYGGNPFAPLVSSPYGYGWGGGWFGSGYTAAYGPYGSGGCCSPCATSCCNPCATGCSPCATGCSPCGGGCGIGGCATGNCATGNCSIPAGNMKPSPDNGVPMNDTTDEPPSTYDDTPTDSPGFQPGGTGTDNNGTDGSLGGFENEAFKIPMGPDGLDVPGDTSPPVNPIDADKPDEDEDEDGLSVPGARFDLHGPSPGPITPRNSAQVQPATHLDRRITWRSRPVIVPERQQLTASRPLIVRKTVKVQLNQAPTTLVSQTNQNK